MNRGLFLFILIFLPLLTTQVLANGYSNVTVSTAKNMTDSNPALVVLDVRTQSEYDSGHIRNAELIPHTELEGRLVELNKTDEILVYCRTGVRSASASQVLADNGFSHVYNMLGGISTWTSAGYTVYVKYSSIQQAVDAASEGEVILVSSGIYHEHLVLNKIVSLLGENKQDTIIDGDGTTVVNVRTDNITISQFTILNGTNGVEFSGNLGSLNITDNIIMNHTGVGILLNQATNVWIRNNAVMLNGRVDGSVVSGWGIDAWNCFGIRIEGNTVTGNYLGGVMMKMSGAVSITKNMISNNSLEGLSPFVETFGVSVTSAWSGMSHEIAGNVISNHTRYGIVLDQCYDGGIRITANTIVDNGDAGIHLESSKDNTICHNNFIGNEKQATICMPSACSNNWDDGYPSGGNYWSDYTGLDLRNGLHQNETGSDGIGDSSYEVNSSPTTPPEQAQHDSYPLKGMFHDFAVTADYGKQHSIQLVSNSTVANLTVGKWLGAPSEYLQPGQEFLQCYVEGEIDTAGFCRVTIPRAVLNGTYLALVDGSEVPTNEFTGSNSTHAYVYFAYQHSRHEVIIVSELSAVAMALLFFVTTLLLVAIRRRKRTRSLVSIDLRSRIRSHVQ